MLIGNKHMLLSCPYEPKNFRNRVDRDARMSILVTALMQTKCSQNNAEITRDIFIYVIRGFTALGRSICI